MDLIIIMKRCSGVTKYSTARSHKFIQLNRRAIINCLISYKNLYLADGLEFI